MMLSAFNNYIKGELCVPPNQVRSVKQSSRGAVYRVPPIARAHCAHCANEYIR